MRIGMFLAYWPWFSFEEQVKLSRLGDELGLDSVWISEAWGHDAVSVLGYLAAKTERIALGSALMQIPARQPTATAMAAVGLDVVSGGRFRLGLGLSGPQVLKGGTACRSTGRSDGPRSTWRSCGPPSSVSRSCTMASTGRFRFRPIRGSDLASRCGCSQPRCSCGYRSTSERSGRKR